MSIYNFIIVNIYYDDDLSNYIYIYKNDRAGGDDK